jgi:peroxiredoxin
MSNIENQRETDSSSHKKQLRQIITPTWIPGLLALSLILNILLASEVSSLRKAVLATKAETRLNVGTEVPIIQGHSVDGRKEVLNYGAFTTPVVLYVFTPQCKWCKKNLDNLHKLIDNSGANYHVVGLALTSMGLKDYLDKEHLLFPVYTDLDESTKFIYHLGGTPQTIIVSPEAKILKVWTGAYQDSIRGEIEAYLKIQLPGCCKLEASSGQP